MASRCYHRNKKTGVTYVYSVESYWDKEKKAPRNRQVCLGRLDEATGEVVPSGRKDRTVARASAAGAGVTVRSAGPALLLDRLGADCGLASLVAKCFPECKDELMSLVYFVVHKGLPLSRIEPWSTATLHPYGGPISSQRVSELLHSISADSRERFMSLWLAKMAETDCLCYDITSVSSYTRSNSYVRFGYNRDGESLAQINLAMVFGQKRRIPYYYRRLPGNITDVATLGTTLESLRRLGAHHMDFVLDRGFYSEANINALLEGHHRFTIAVPVGRKWVEHIIDRHVGRVASPGNYISIDDGEALYAATTLHKWGAENRRTYLHIYYNARQAAEAFDLLTRDLIRWKEEVESGRRVNAHEDAYARFLTVRDTPKRGLKVSFNEDAIQNYRKKYAGFFCILSNGSKDAAQTLVTYRNKEAVENCFDDLKNQLDMRRLRVHSPAAMDNRLFVQFLALILISLIRNVIQNNRKLRNLTVREVMEEMETMVKLTYECQYGAVYTERSPLQRDIIAAFALSLTA